MEHTLKCKIAKKIINGACIITKTFLRFRGMEHMIEYMYHVCQPSSMVMSVSLTEHSDIIGQNCLPIARKKTVPSGCQSLQKK
jgi:hypothetical protein